MQSDSSKVAVQDTLAPDAIGLCPVCGGDVLEGENSYFCLKRISIRSCHFRVSKDFLARWGKGKLTVKTMARLLDDDMIDLQGLVSPKTGRQFDCQGVLMWFEKHNYWGVKFIFTQKDLNKVLRSRGW